MVRPIPIHVGEISFSPVPLAIALFVSVSALVALCAKHARQVPSKYDETETSTPKSPGLRTPKQLITTLSNKAMIPLVHAKKSLLHPGNNNTKAQEEMGLWQKAILMGEKCQPPEFSGVIYYDYSGNRIPEMPKSPRAAHMSPLRNFTSFPAQRMDKSLH
ncbi:uncharacterized protein LOC105156423 [Sesamum indicum]|uniref:Uncharacterized protein LOC105156423 n=1 Tax=Sesamum indicum TaxID=4182 RepID=A0A6I9SLR1_SESIN|nr:uncharacterized protein LOC105156423 [Sesamum indicum]